MQVEQSCSRLLEPKSMPLAKVLTLQPRPYHQARLIV